MSIWVVIGPRECGAPGLVTPEALMLPTSFHVVMPAANQFTWSGGVPPLPQPRQDHDAFDFVDRHRVSAVRS